MQTIHYLYLYESVINNNNNLMANFINKRQNKVVTMTGEKNCKRKIFFFKSLKQHDETR